MRKEGVVIPTTLYIAFSDDGQQIRRWSREPFEGAIVYRAEHIPASEWMKHPSVG